MTVRATGLDLVTGAFSYSGSRIAAHLLDAGREVRTLTFHADRVHPLRERIEARTYRFDDPVALARDLNGVDTLYNTYWVRFDRGTTTLETVAANSRLLFYAAARAGVRRIVHVSIANPGIESRLPYYRSKAYVERALSEVGVPYAIVRPTLIFGGERDVLVNNIAWLLRHSPVFALPGDGSYAVQPVHVDDVARVCMEAAEGETDRIVDAAGPETMSFLEMVRAIRGAVGTRAPVLHIPPIVMAGAASALGLLMHDVVLTVDEISGLMAGLLTSDHAPTGRIRFSDWLHEHGHSLGRAYANELVRHFARPSANRERHIVTARAVAGREC
jgi:uncharacterized protein YbjT (DUF2867 family)